MDTKNWWQSKTIWSTVVAAIAGGLALTGHSIDAGTQGQLIDAASNIASGIGIVASVLAAYYRSKATTTIAPTPPKST